MNNFYAGAQIYARKTVKQRIKVVPCRLDSFLPEEEDMMCKCEDLSSDSHYLCKVSGMAVLADGPCSTGGPKQMTTWVTGCQLNSKVRGTLF